MRYFNDISDSVEKCHKMNRFGDAFRWLNRIYKNHMILSHKLELESLLGQIHQMYLQVNVAGITSLVAVFLSKWILSSAFTEFVEPGFCIDTVPSFQQNESLR